MSTPMWKMRINDCLRRSNKVNLSGENIDDLEKIGTIKLMVQLDLSFVRTIHSFEGFKRQPALKTFIADGSSISSLKNVSSLSNITALSLKNTPLMKANQPFNVIASLILVIPSLRVFNGKVISQKTRGKVESACYPMPESANLVNAGWVVEYPCPSKKKIIELLKEYGIYNENELGEELNEEEINEEEVEAEINDENSIFHSSENESYNDHIQTTEKDNIDENNTNSKDQDNENLNEPNQNIETNSPEQKENANDYDEYENNNEMEYTTETNENEYDDEVEDDNDNENNSRNDNFPPINKPIKEMSLLEKVSLVLRSNGYEVDPNNMLQSVLNIIDSLCSEVERINSSLPSEQSSQV